MVQLCNIIKVQFTMWKVLLAFFLCMELVEGSDLLFKYGKGVNGEKTLPKGDVAMAFVDLSNRPFTFAGQHYYQLYIATDGIIWFNKFCSPDECPIPSPFPINPPNPAVACYWADGDTSANTNGLVSYRVVEGCNTNEFLAAKQYVLESNRTALNEDWSSPGPCQVMVVTWSEMTYPYGDDTTPVNTFQCAVMSMNKTSTYVIWAFKQLQYTNGLLEQGHPAVAGVDTGNPIAKHNDMQLEYSGTPKVLELQNVKHIPVFTTDEMVTLTVPKGRVNRKMELVTPKFLPGFKTHTTGSSQCVGNGDPHYRTFDGTNVWEHFGHEATGWQDSKINNGKPTFWFLAARNCKRDKVPIQTDPFPPFTVHIATEFANKYGWDPTTRSMRMVLIQFRFDKVDVLDINGKKIKGHHMVYLLKMKDYPATSVSASVCDFKTATQPSDTCTDIGGPGYEEVRTTCSSNTGTGSFCLKQSSGTKKVTLHSDNEKAFLVSLDIDNFEMKLQLPNDDRVQGTIEGMCGNFDGNGGNDIFCDMEQAPTSSVWEYCWKTNDPFADINSVPFYPNCPTTQGGIVNKKTQMKIRKQKAAELKKLPLYVQNEIRMAEQQCSIINDTSGPFKECHANENPGMMSFYWSCVGDLSIMNCAKSTLCGKLSSFEIMCQKKYPGIALNWRSQIGCAQPSCGENAYYTQNASSCPPTCTNLNSNNLCSIPPSAGCQCKDGYVLSDNNCVLVQDCSTCIDADGNVRKHGQKWTTQDCQQTCSCEGGHILCSSATACSDHAVCSGGSCICDKNYYGDGYTCSEKNHCEPDPCQNKGTCINTAAGYTCICSRGWEGVNCGSKIDYCHSNPCVHGTCTNSLDGPDCTCSHGYIGTLCDRKVDWCSLYPCRNLATCHSTSNWYTCTCQQGCTGANCTEQINYCESYCLNGGTCRLTPPGTRPCSISATCTCPVGYSGTKCETNLATSTTTQNPAIFCALHPGCKFSTGGVCPKSYSECVGTTGNIQIKYCPISPQTYWKPTSECTGECVANCS